MNFYAVVDMLLPNISRCISKDIDTLWQMFTQHSKSLTYFEQPLHKVHFFIAIIFEV